MAQGHGHRLIDRVHLFPTEWILGTYKGIVTGIVTLTGLVFEGDPDVASLDDQHFLQAPPFSV